MQKSLYFIVVALVAATVGRSQSVGIGTSTPLSVASLHVLGKKTTDSSSIGILIQDTTGGIGLEIPQGGALLGPYRFRPPFDGQLSVASPSDTAALHGSSAAIVGITANHIAAKHGGVFGGSLLHLGVGVQGLGAFGGSFVDFNADQSLADVGVWGSGLVGVAGIGHYFGVYAQAINLTDSDLTNAQYGIYAAADPTTATDGLGNVFAGYFAGDVYVSGVLTQSGVIGLIIDNPTDPANKYLYHSTVESPDMMNIYNGNVTTDDNGVAKINMPTYFNALNKDFRYQLTSIGSFAQAIVKTEMEGNSFTVQTSQPNVKVSWQVTGVRKDKFAEAHRVQAEVVKEPWNKGKYLNAKEHGVDISKSIPYALSEAKKNERTLALGARPNFATDVKEKIGAVGIKNNNLKGSFIRKDIALPKK